MGVFIALGISCFVLGLITRELVIIAGEAERIKHEKRRKLQAQNDLVHYRSTLQEQQRTWQDRREQEHNNQTRCITCVYHDYKCDKWPCVRCWEIDKSMPMNYYRPDYKNAPII